MAEFAIPAGHGQDPVAHQAGVGAAPVMPVPLKPLPAATPAQDVPWSPAVVSASLSTKSQQRSVRTLAERSAWAVSSPSSTMAMTSSEPPR